MTNLETIEAAVKNDPKPRVKVAAEKRLRELNQ